MKRKLTVIAAIAVCISILALGSLAYFTAQDNAENHITTGNLAIDVVEIGADGQPFVNQIGVMPGDTIVKEVSVENIGDNTAWIRVKVTMTCTANGEPLPTDGITLDYNTAEWIYSDGYYYFNSRVEANNSTADLFSNVTFDATLGNEYQNAELIINVEADAVQYDNNGATVMEAQGWPAE